MAFNYVYIFYDKVTLLNTVTDTCIVIRHCSSSVSKTAKSNSLFTGA